MIGILARFLRFGLLAFGGPVAQIAMLRRELVDEERWISSDRFNRLLAVYQALPGPEAHELAVHLGYVRGGRLGGFLAGLGFMLPGFVLVVAAAVLYVSIDLRQPSIAAALLGVQVAVIALIARAVERIGRHIVTSLVPGMIAVAAGAATLAGVPFWLALPLGGVAAVVAARGVGLERATVAVLATVAIASLTWLAAAAAGIPPVTAGPPGVGPGGAPVDATLAGLLGSGLKAGLLTFGGAYTAIPFVRADAVGGGWLTDAQFLDAVALSGILPAPLIMFGAFVGYLAGGLPGAVAMTLGIFIPAFAFALVLGDRIEAIVDRPGLRRLLEGVAAGVVGIIAVTALDLAVALAGRVPNIAGAGAILAASLLVVYGWASRAAVPAAIALGAVLGLLLLGPSAG